MLKSKILKQVQDLVQHDFFTIFPFVTQSSHKGGRKFGGLFTYTELFEDSVQYLFGCRLSNHFAKGFQCRSEFKGNELKGGTLFQSLQGIGKIIPRLSKSILVANVCHDKVLRGCPYLPVNQ